MITLQDVQNNILTAELKVANMVDKNVLSEMGGALSTNWKSITKATRAINVISWKHSIGDIASPAFESAYACLLSFIGTYAAGAINPNAQQPGQTVITIPVLIGYNKNTIPFNKPIGVTNFVLSNYNTTYKMLYGNNPDPLSIYTIQGGIEQLDEQTAPIIDRIDPSNINSDINDITWEYGSDIAVIGYVLIGGVAPAGSGTPSGSGGAIPFTYTEADLIFDGTAQAWYLPLTLPLGYVVTYASSNGVSIGNQFNQNYTPNRLYGFANNATQSILVKII